MADIIYAQPQSKSGLGISLGDILPIAALGALALGAYWFLTRGGSNGTPSQGTNTGPQLGPVTGNGGTGAGTEAVQAVQGMSTADQVALQIRQLAANLAAASTKPVTVTQTPTGTPVINVNAGKDTPTNFFPGGNNVISYSQQPTQAMIQETVQNLVSSQATQNITNAWWQPQTLTNPQNWGINSAGSPQSDIPSGKRHCPCTAALKASGVCGPNDDWYYC